MNTLGIIIFIFYQDLRRQLDAISATSINQWHASLQIPLVRHSGTSTDWLKSLLFSLVADHEVRPKKSEKKRRTNYKKVLPKTKLSLSSMIGHFS